MKFINEDIEKYCLEITTDTTEVQNKLEVFTKENVPVSQMLTGKMETAFLQFLIRSMEAKNILEIGTYTGYGTLAMANAIPDNGKVVTLDMNEEVVAIAKKFWMEANVDHKVTSILGPAVESMSKLASKFDLIFIDADKENYLNYFKAGLELLSDKGVIIVDNVLWSGAVLTDTDDKATQSIQELNNYIKDNKDYYSVMLPIRDGVLLIKPL